MPSRHPITKMRTDRPAHSVSDDKRGISAWLSFRMRHGLIPSDSGQFVSFGRTLLKGRNEVAQREAELVGWW